MNLCTASSRLLLYDTNSWDLKKTYGCYDGLLRDISWSDDGKYILQVNSKGLIEILSPADHDIRSLQHIPLKDTWSASFHRDGHRNIAIGTRTGNVMIWDTKNKSIIKTFPTPTQQCSVNFLSYNAKNTSLAATMHNGDTVIYGLVSNISVLTVRLASSKSISAMKFHHDSRSILGLATDEGHVALRDITTNKDKVLFENVHASPVSDFIYSMINKDVMLSTGYDKVMHVYDVRLQNVVSTVKTSYPLTCVSINTDNQVALGTKNKVILVYDLRDLSNPLKVLKGHDDEVRRVTFQPLRKKAFSTEISLREDTEINFNHSPQKMHSPVRKRASDILFMADTPPKNNLEVSAQSENKADSFLVMMGLDKSNNECDDEGNRSFEPNEKRSEKQDVKYKLLDIEKNMSKVSTPLNSRIIDNLGFSSPFTNGVTEVGQTPGDINLSNIKPTNTGSQVAVMDAKVVEELKDFVNLTLSNNATDNKNYFLHIMMALTKQKLYLEKQLTAMDHRIESLVLNQNDLVETNRRLVLEIEKLKSQQNLSY